MCKTCRGSGSYEIEVERIVGSRIGIHRTETAMRKVMCTDCDAALRSLDFARPTGSERRKGDTWPMLSEVMGVHPSQIAEAAALDRKLGVKVDYHPDGRVKYNDPAERRKHCEAHGYFDRNGGYSDPQRGRCRAYDPEYKKWAERKTG